MLRDMEGQLGDFSGIIKPKSKVEIIETDLDDIILVDGSPMIMMIDGEPFPTLKGALELDIKTKFVVVDMGAVKFVIKGADIMSPGITDADPNIVEGDLVVIVDETHHKPLATGRSLLTGPEMVENREGKAIKNIHHVGDEIWDLVI
ncbi:universal PUA-domain-containing protein [Methanobacterium lacus]|uniref:Universal PUA-domain-containing protein n=2 Tax=Methanobacterium lacus (strain AL-21) TaxID=877455 RepID=F0TBX9_METLA|nr:universal PUA-domain-containing protein [Methanobacterium lacus]